ncbi:hypothetical protein QR680_000509 [Steinernema hermaphroditum]|uniref:Uncharacterized protein n=1 Tax=Steinernema hermaphroditum TaxID=289476 RepID=A0AA39GXM2_9BILA|nr:hypothetical protein QR680_000509 [Steinernema hermaphroditum]
MISTILETLEYYGISLTTFFCIWLLVAVCSFYFGVFIGHQINKYYQRRAKVVAAEVHIDVPRFSYNPQVAYPY